MSDKNRSAPRRGESTRAGSQPRSFVWPSEKGQREAERPNAQTARTARPAGQHAAPTPPPPEPEYSQSENYLTLAIARRDRLRVMTIRYCVAVGVLVLIRMLIAYTYTLDPSWWSIVLDALPIILIGLLCVNLAMRPGVIRQEGWILAAVLLVVGMVLFVLLSRGLGAWFKTLARSPDIWQLANVPLLAVRPLLEGASLSAIFLITWKIAFGTSPERHLNLRPLYHPLVLILQVIGCLAVAYLSMVSYSHLMSGAVYGLLGQGAPASATWYNPDSTAVLAALYKPVQCILYAGFVFPGLWAVRTGKMTR